jgi:hypothetical protein
MTPLKMSFIAGVVTLVASLGSGLAEAADKVASPS